MSDATPRSAASRSRWWRWAGPLALAVGLVGCGGGGGYGGGGGGDYCSTEARKAWLYDYLQDWYFWYAISPRPAPDSYGSLDSYFAASLYTGTDINFPADRWSSYTSTSNFDRFYAQGRALGYGVMVAGIEVDGRPDLPLYIRYIEPGSPAALFGLGRGDQILSVNGRSAASMIAANDYSALSAVLPGDLATLLVRNSSGDRSVTLSATDYALAPVANVAVLSSPGGRKVGYVQIKDMISQAQPGLDDAFASFRQAGVQEVALDLRYNGGGLVSVGRDVASYPAAASTAGGVYTSLLYNNRHANANTDYIFKNFANGLGLSRVYVLTGPRTCSAAEQVINGLRPFVDVVTVGDTTCGKPVGFLPQEDNCSTVWSTVNFEAVNADYEGRYFDGFAATCPVAEDFSKPLGSVSEPLLATALNRADGVACATARAQAQGVSPAPRGARHLWQEPGDRGGMLGR
jgi:carboxyl-terminal processing protease